jgi:hypothetical protein
VQHAFLMCGTLSPYLHVILPKLEKLGGNLGSNQRILNGLKKNQAFLRWSAPRPPPSPLRRQKVASLVERKGEEGVGEEPNHTTARKPGPL